MENSYIKNIEGHIPIKRIPMILKKIEDEAKSLIIEENSPFSLVLENDKGKSYRVANLNLIIRDVKL